MGQDVEKLCCGYTPDQYRPPTSLIRTPVEGPGRWAKMWKNYAAATHLTNVPVWLGPLWKVKADGPRCGKIILMYQSD